jgi:hypothetical protein
MNTIDFLVVQQEKFIDTKFYLYKDKGLYYSGLM